MFPARIIFTPFLNPASAIRPANTESCGGQDKRPSPGKAAGSVSYQSLGKGSGKKTHPGGRRGLAAGRYGRRWVLSYRQGLYPPSFPRRPFARLVARPIIRPFPSLFPYGLLLSLYGILLFPPRRIWRRRTEAGGRGLIRSSQTAAALRILLRIRPASAGGRFLSKSPGPRRLFFMNCQRYRLPPRYHTVLQNPAVSQNEGWQGRR